MLSTVRSFDLVLLEEGEEYISDAACNLVSPFPSETTAQTWQQFVESLKNAHTCRAKGEREHEMLNRGAVRKGRLRLGTKSLIFEPDALDSPILKLHFQHITAITDSVHVSKGIFVACTRITSVPTAIYNGKTRFLSAYDVHVAKGAAAGVAQPSSGAAETGGSVAMHLPGFVFIFAYATDAMHDEQLSEYVRHWGAYSLNVETEGPDTRRTGGFSQALIQPREKALLGCASSSIHTESVYCWRLKRMVRHGGYAALTDRAFYFQPCPNFSRKSCKRVAIDRILHVFKRDSGVPAKGESATALEIISLPEEPFEKRVQNARKPYSCIYLEFKREDDREKFTSTLKSIIPRAFFALESRAFRNEMTQLWRRGVLPNFQYIDFLNCISGRSRHDMSHYPVFPWVIADYESVALDLKNPKTFRDLSKPIGALNPDRLSHLKNRMSTLHQADKATAFADTVVDGDACSCGEKKCDGCLARMWNNGFYLYCSHYSTPALVVFFLIRLQPECQLRLYSGKFDSAARTFKSISETFHNVLHGHSSFFELIPEFYGGNDAFLRNQLNITTQDGRLCDVELPRWAGNSSAQFMRLMRNALESEHVSKHLHEWIDLIFGYKQAGLESIKSDNTFHPLSYLSSVRAGKLPMTSATQTLLRTMEPKAASVQVREFGQAPVVVFDTPHPQRLRHPHWQANDDPVASAPWFIYVNHHSEIFGGSYADAGDGVRLGRAISQGCSEGHLRSLVAGGASDAIKLRSLGAMGDKLTAAGFLPPCRQFGGSGADLGRPEAADVRDVGAGAPLRLLGQRVHDHVQPGAHLHCQRESVLRESVRPGRQGILRRRGRGRAVLSQADPRRRRELRELQRRNAHERGLRRDGEAVPADQRGPPAGGDLRRAQRAPGGHLLRQRAAPHCDGGRQPDAVGPAGAAHPHLEPRHLPAGERLQGAGVRDQQPVHPAGLDGRVAGHILGRAHAGLAERVQRLQARHRGAAAQDAGRHLRPERLRVPRRGSGRGVDAADVRPAHAVRGAADGAGGRRVSDDHGGERVRRVASAVGGQHRGRREESSGHGIIDCMVGFAEGSLALLGALGVAVDGAVAQRLEQLLPVRHHQDDQQAQHHAQRVEDELLLVLLVEPVHEDDGLGEVVEGVEQGDDLVALEHQLLGLPEGAHRNLQRGKLDLAVQAALLAADAVYNVGNLRELLDERGVPQTRRRRAGVGGLADLLRANLVGGLHVAAELVFGAQELQQLVLQGLVALLPEVVGEAGEEGGEPAEGLEHDLEGVVEVLQPVGVVAELLGVELGVAQVDGQLGLQLERRDRVDALVVPGGPHRHGRLHARYEAEQVLRLVAGHLVATVALDLVDVLPVVGAAVPGVGGRVVEQVDVDGLVLALGVDAQKVVVPHVVGVDVLRVQLRRLLVVGVPHDEVLEAVEGGLRGHLVRLAPPDVALGDALRGVERDAGVLLEGVVVAVGGVGAEVVACPQGARRVQVDPEDAKVQRPHNGDQLAVHELRVGEQVFEAEAVVALQGDEAAGVLERGEVVVHAAEHSLSMRGDYDTGDGIRLHAVQRTDRAGLQRAERPYGSRKGSRKCLHFGIWSSALGGAAHE
ncbi:neutral sphingomyelinase [Babesia caballi]|uniref:Neutral sphingomyelinase n=1 Tax=Babesia caballi TaxID=5871 RepID=A0AAV4LZH4_BABCB|nr:neutral sphingomyelinase [Babesia caballi]